MALTEEAEGSPRINPNRHEEAFFSCPFVLSRGANLFPPSGSTRFFDCSSVLLINLSGQEGRLSPFCTANYPTNPNALTGNVPIPLTLTGTVKNLKPAPGRAPRLHKCSTMGISDCNRIECAGLDRSAVSSMFRES